MNRLPILVLLLFGLSACGSIQLRPQSSTPDVVPSGSKVQDLIIGKWKWQEVRKRRAKDGPLEIVPVPDSLDANIEYFKDNTFKHTNGGEESQVIKNGKWIVLDDGTIKETYDDCLDIHSPNSVGTCKEKITVIKVIFPDSDTLLDFGEVDRTDVGTYSEYVEKFSVYKRIN